MTKMTPRDKILLVALSVVAILAVLYQFAYVPLQDKKIQMKDEIAGLEAQTKDIQSLQVQLDNIKSQSSELETEINKMDAQKGFGVMNYQELMTYLGESAKEYKVDITSFHRMKYENKVNYWEVPFEITVQGEYQNIILFVDSIYQLNEYFAIRQLNLQQIDMIPMTQEQAAEEGSSGFAWGPHFIQRLNENVPSNLLTPKEDENKEEEKDRYEQYLSSLNNNGKVERKVELMFSFHFISLEETPEDLKE